MDRIIKAVLKLSVYGMILVAAEQAVPRSGTKKACRAAFGLLFIQVIAEQITGILQ